MANNLSSKTFSLFQFIIPVLLGICGFLMVAGPNILDFQNIAWLDGDLDPPQHYLGWALYRNGPWTFPVGLNPNNGLDISNAIVFSDSVPIMAFLFKPFSLFLPKVFQYLGFWTLVCFILQTWFAWKLVGLLSNSLLFRVFGAGIFLFSPIMLMRVGLWTALASHFLILAAFYLIFRPNQSLRSLCWGVLLGIASLTHFYLLVMVCLLWFGNLVDIAFLRKKMSSQNVIREFFIVAMILAICLWQGGYFSLGLKSGSAVVGYGALRFNLLAPFDSRGWSYVLKPIPMQVDFGNGFNYFGLGIFVAIAFAVGGILRGKRKLPEIIKLNNHYFLYLCLLGLFVFAVSNTISIGEWKYTYYLPQTVISWAGTLRASGRMFWPIYYLIIFILIAVIHSAFSKNAATLILGVCFFIQVVDTSAGWIPIHRELNRTHTSVNPTPLQNELWREFAVHYKKIIRYPTSNARDYWQHFATLAASHQMGTNTINFARYSQIKIDQANEKIAKQLKEGNLDDSALYILDPWKKNPHAIAFDKKTDVLAKIDGFKVLAPNWKKCLSCKPIPSELEIESYAPKVGVGKAIYFSRDSEGRKEFLLDGWGPYGEDWGSWSEGDEASLILPLASNKLKLLQLDVRAFVVKQHPKQNVEVYVNNVLKNTISLEKFEFNRIDIPLPPNAMMKESITIRFKLLNATSPKSVGISDDDRKLGIGMVKAVFQ